MPFSPGTTLFTATGYYLVEPEQTGVPVGYVVARRAERPMSQARLIRLSDVIGATAAASLAAPALRAVAPTLLPA
jgi:hypothetical protein